MNRTDQIPEDFFHFIWKFRLLSAMIRSTSGEKITIIDPGMHNEDSGPDFSCARIRIGSTTWVGNVEIHKYASDWYRHGHDRDPAYGNIILHIVVVNDVKVRGINGQEMQTLCIQNYYNHALLERYGDISQNLHWVPCMKLIKYVSNIHFTDLINTMGIERLMTKSNNVLEELKLCNMDWEECCYRMICKQFGARVNISNFEMLARVLPVRLMMKYHEKPFQVEALLFGQSGLLSNRFYAQYPLQLKREYHFLASKHSLKNMPGYLWKFLRMRPAAFPTIRIAQLATLYSRHQSLLHSIIEAEDIDTLLKLFDVSASTYWNTHYLFDRKTVKKQKRFGKQSIQVLLINTVIPLMHLYAEQMNKPGIRERALQFMEALPPEDNAIIRRWKAGGVNAFNALETQGLIHLKKTKCDMKLCLKCKIGHQLLRQKA